MTLIKSMTGYGRAVETIGNREYTVELRSVNNRYLDCSVRLPRMLSFTEEAVKQAVKQTISRGKVDVFISVRSEGGDDKSVDMLSGGTRDLAYIATRAALIDMLYNEKPPVVFDESFAHQDNVRAKSMMRGIAELAKEGCQSFIFTCRSREGMIAKEVLKTSGVFKLSVVDGE